MSRRTRYLFSTLILASCAAHQTSTVLAPVTVQLPSSCDPSRLTPVPHREVIERLVAQKAGTMGRARKNMVASSHALATRIGREVLAKGGNAVDAFVAAVLVQDMVLPGVTSTAGIAGYLVALPGSAATYVHGPYRRPSRDGARPNAGDPAGRQVLLPGAPFALIEGQARLGRLPLRDVLAPVERLAREGFLIDALFARAIKSRAEILRSSPYGTKTFFSAGAPLQAGDRLVLPELADTLARVAKNGAKEFSSGVWARSFIEEVSRHGGTLAAEDLADLHAVFAAPAEATYRGRRLLASSNSSFGGRKLLLALAILEHADLKRLGPPDTSPESLALLVRTQRAVENEPWIFDRSLAGDALAKRIAERSSALWPGVRDGATTPPSSAQGGHHSSAVIVVDGDGGVVVGTHTIETLNWGRGVFAGGIPLGTAGAGAPRADSATGVEVPDPLSSVIVMENGTPRIALTVYGTGLHPADLQVLLGMLDYGRDPEQAVLAPRLGWFSFDLMKMKADTTRNLLDLRIEPSVRCALGALGDTLVQHEMPGYPPGRLDLGFPTVVEIRGSGAARELLGMTPEWMEGVAAGD